VDRVDAPLSHRYHRAVVITAAVPALIVASRLFFDTVSTGECALWGEAECFRILDYLAVLALSALTFWVVAGTATVVLLMVDALGLGWRRLMGHIRVAGGAEIHRD